MSAKSNFVLMAAVVAVAAAGLAWRLHDRIVAGQIALSVASDEHTRIEGEIRRAQLLVAEAESRRAKLQAERDAATKVRAGQSVLPRGKPAAPRRARVQDDPAAQAMDLKRFRAGLVLRYGALYRALGLGPEQIDRFEALLTERQGETLDLTAIAAARGLPPSDAAIATLRREGAARLKAGQIALLGEAGYAELEEFNRGEDRRRVVRELVGDTVLSAEPLAATQARQLDDTLAKVNFKGVAGADHAVWLAVMTRAQVFLSPAQLAGLSAQATQAQRQNAMDELSRMIDAAKK